MLDTVGRDPLLFTIHIGVLVALAGTGAAFAARTFEARLVRG
jgi:hypothetical protein